MKKTVSDIKRSSAEGHVQDAMWGLECAVNSLSDALGCMAEAAETNEQLEEETAMLSMLLAGVAVSCGSMLATLKEHPRLGKEAVAAQHSILGKLKLPKPGKPSPRSKLDERQEVLL